MIVLTVKSSSSPQAPRKTRKITGTVVDPDGLPIIGANVIEQGTTNGSITDLDGKFELIITENAILNISYIVFRQTNNSQGRNLLTGYNDGRHPEVR